MADELVNSNENGNTETNTEQKSSDTASLEARIKQLEKENGKLKQSVTNASADASEWKKKFQDTLSEQDKAKVQQDEANAALQKELEDLRNERNIANHKAQFISIGFEDALAQETAQALNAADTAKVFDGIRKFIASHDKALAEKAMLNNPTLPGGNTTKTVTREEFNNMGYKEMVQFQAEHPDLYEEYMGRTKT